MHTTPTTTLGVLAEYHAAHTAPPFPNRRNVIVQGLNRMTAE